MRSLVLLVLTSAVLVAVFLRHFSSIDRPPTTDPLIPMRDKTVKDSRFGSHSSINAAGPDLQLYKNAFLEYQLTIPKKWTYQEIPTDGEDPRYKMYSVRFLDPDTEISLSVVSSQLADGGYQWSGTARVERESMIVDTRRVEKAIIRESGEIRQLIVLGFRSTTFNHWITVEFGTAPTLQDLDRLETVIRSFHTSKSSAD